MGIKSTFTVGRKGKERMRRKGDREKKGIKRRAKRDKEREGSKKVSIGGRLVGFTACQHLLGYLMPKSFFFC